MAADRVIAAVSCLRHGDTVSCLFAAADPAFSVVRPVHHLREPAIGKTISENAASFEFVSGRDDTLLG
jgi:hypothetical protein